MPKERHISSYREKIRLSFHPIGEPNATFGPYLGIRYEASGPIDAGVLVRDMVGHCYLWDDAIFRMAFMSSPTCLSDCISPGVFVNSAIEPPITSTLG